MAEIKTINYIPLADTTARENITTINENITTINENISQLSDSITDLQNGVSLIEPKEDDIPKVFLEGGLPTTKTETTMKFRYISTTLDFEGYVEIKCQGSSSMNYDKKNFTIKLYEDEALSVKLKKAFKGWGKQRKFVLKANYIDITHARNIVNARLWGQIVKSRSDYDTLPEELRNSPNQGAVDGFPIKLYSNGVYQGRYTWNIPKDGWMANMNDELETHCIISGNGYGSACFNSSSNIQVGTGEWQDELHDTVPTAINTRWLEVQDFVMNSIDEDFVNNFKNYFDKQSVIDYFVFAVTQTGLDAFGKNQMYFTYDGIKWIASMYDMDSTWGLWWNGTSFVASDYARTSFQDYIDTSSTGGNKLYIRLLSLMYEDIKLRYSELRNSVLAVDNIINEFERFTDITPLDLIKEDYAATTANGTFTGIPLKTSNNVQQLRTYIVDRLAYCDSYFNALAGVVNCIGITLDASTLTFNTADTQTLVATVTPSDCTDEIVWESSDENVCTVYNGMVTPIYDGTATITVNCGLYSATCDITVSGVAVNTNAKYPLESGTLKYDDTYQVSVSNGNHIYYTSNGNAQNMSKFVNLRKISNGSTISTDEWFTLNSGDVVTFAIENFTYNEGNAYEKAIIIALLDTSSNVITELNSLFTTTKTLTLSEAKNIACIRFFNNSASDVIVDLEFDLTLTVNDVRYI